MPVRVAEADMQRVRSPSSEHVSKRRDEGGYRETTTTRKVLLLPPCLSSPTLMAQRRTNNTTAPDAGSTLLAGAATPEVGLPRKRFYRQRAHANPLSIHHLE